MKHNPQLDGFRALAVSLVVFSHFVGIQEFGPRAWLEYGRMGVVAFFVLSGFLITFILLGYKQRMSLGELKRKEAWRRFFVRRTLRIFPLYFFVLFLFGYVVGLDRIRDQLWWHVSYLSNIGQGVWDINYGNVNHFWSLCVEEQFYLLWPIAILLLPQEKVPSFMKALLGISVLAGVVWVVIGAPGKFINYSPLGSCSFALGAGGLLAHQLRQNQTIPATHQFWLLAAGSILFIAALLGGDKAFGFYLGLLHDTSWSMLCVWLLIQLAEGRATLLAAAPIAWIGKISYGIYIYHLILPIYFPQLFSRLHIGPHSTPLLRFSVEVASVIAVASASYLVLERPFLRLKEHLAG